MNYGCSTEAWNDYNRLLRLMRAELRPKKVRVSKALTPEEQRDYHHLRRLAFPDAFRSADRRWKSRNPDKVKAKSRKWESEHPGYRSKKQKGYRVLNPENYRARDRKRKVARAKYRRERRATDINFKLGCALRNRLWTALKGSEKNKRTLVLLGCSIPSFRLYLESKFEPGMTWENYGRGEGTWQIDHIMPCAIFDLTRADHQERCFHFSNLQPLWTIENQRKNRTVGYERVL